MLARVSTIQQQLLQSWDVLATITPHDYSAFRNTLGKSSGFQSPQYRLLEFLIGNKNADLIKVFRNDPPMFETLERALRAPSLYDEVLRLLSRRGLDVPPEAIDRDFTQPYQASKQVAAAWLSVYHNSVKEWDLYELAERLVDLDYKFQLWRFAHVKTVERIIGYKRGTGGTGGVSYLTKAWNSSSFRNFGPSAPPCSCKRGEHSRSIAERQCRLQRSVGDAGRGQTASAADDQGAADTVLKSREAVRAILERRDPRLFVVVGPCSIHDVAAAREYAGRLKALAERVSSTLLLIMRVYFEKPRTTVGWKGLINDPDLDDSFHIEKGILLARELLLYVAELGLPAGTEALDPIMPQYLSELITWTAIGARTTDRKRTVKWRADCRRRWDSRTARMARWRRPSMRCNRYGVRIISSASLSKASQPCFARPETGTHTSCCAAAAAASTTTP